MAVSSVRIRMYNVGFGDCFLLTFAYGSGKPRHMLVDYGSTAPPEHGPRGYTGNYMKTVADDIAKECDGKLHIVVATHRHRDHVSGFATTGDGTGKIIAGLKPDVVIQPWTEDPNAPVSALTAKSSSYTGGKPDDKHLAAHFLGTLADMHRVADVVHKLSRKEDFAGRDTRRQLGFLGEDNVQNESAVKNLMDMGRRGKALYVNAGMKLNSLLPGVKVSVLGPPTLKQSKDIRKMRSSDPSEFWQFRSFWASQGHSLASIGQPGSRLFPVERKEPPPCARWFVRAARQAHADQMLELVRDLDSVMNNTSVILLLEIGATKILLPGDAQIENWAYALSQKEWTKALSSVNVYKVGHHGSRNATPKTLWKQFANRGDEHRHDRLESLCSTKSGKHGNARAGTEVPQHLLVEALSGESALTSTEDYRGEFYRDFTIEIRRGGQDG